jgi:uncharacterized protein (DUF1684 family)
MTRSSSFRPVVSALVACALAATFATALAAATAEDGFDSQLAAWKQWRVERLRQPDGWLTLVGLFWLRPGDNSVGSDPEATVRLPDGKSPLALGTLRVDGARAVFVAAPGAQVTSSGKPVATLALDDDAAAGGPTILRHGTLELYVIERAGRLAVRVKDSDSETLRRFAGLDYFPADRAWRIPARFEPAAAGSTLDVPNALGFSEKIRQPGWVTFDLAGRTYRLTALDDTGDGRLFIVFGDLTNGHDTYGGGRFLYTDPPRDGRVEIDFNRAYNPPCVFTPYATCPLPPPGNRLPVRVEAGEKKYSLAVHHS